MQHFVLLPELGNKKIKRHIIVRHYAAAPRLPQHVKYLLEFGFIFILSVYNLKVILETVLITKLS